MRFNREKLKEARHSWEQCTDEQLISMLQAKINWLASHNKNYNNNQYYLILDMQEILTGLEETYKG